MWRFVRAVALSIALAGCVHTDFDVPGARSDATQYDAAYPIYLEYCAFSAITKKPGFGIAVEGGAGGHAAFYLRGACRDASQHYPVLRLCDGRDADDGAGLSMDGNFDNAVWVVTPGRRFFFDGGLRPGERLTQAVYERVQRRAMGLGVLDGVRFDPALDADRPAGMSPDVYRYELSIGTDYAVGLARGRFCARVPLSHAQLVAAVSELNAVNARYRHGPKEYDPNVFQDNCVHLPHNALAAADVWAAWPTEMWLPIAVLDFPVPKNDFVDLVRRTNDLDLGDLAALYHDPVARRDVMDFGRLPTGPGSLSYAAPPWPRNDVYDTDVNSIFYDLSVTRVYTRRFGRIFEDPRYYDLAANRLYFRQLHAELMRDRQPLSVWQRRLGAAEQQDFAEFYTRFYKVIEILKY